MTLEHGGNTKQRVRRTRKSKDDVRADKINDGQRQIKEKFLEQRKILPLQAKTENQRLALKAFTEHQCVILTNHAGVGKTELMCWWAAKQWLEGHVDNIVITRPYKHIGADFGATKGNDAEKLLPFCMSMLMKLKKYLGVGILKNNFKLDGFESFFTESSGIQIVAAEKIQGLSFSERTIILADEMQNMSVPQMKALMTRAEEGCQLLLSGDPQQTAISGKNGLEFITELLEKYPTDYVKIIRFTKEDVVRGGLAGHLVRAFEQMGDVW
jgi:phosphate starvation-inducible PhoH-like protein